MKKSEDKLTDKLMKNKIEKDIFQKRRQSKLILLILFAVIYTVSSLVSGFQNELAFLSIPNGIIWLFKNFIPTQNSIKYLPAIIKTAFRTVLFAVSATTISSIFALIMAIIGSQTTGINRATQITTKVIASFFRNMPLVAWSLILLLSFRQSELTGLLALIFVTFGYLTRTFSETIDEVAGNIIEALSATGATYFQIIFQGVIPTVSGQLISWLLYFIENSIREVTLIGVLTGTGIGFVFNLYYRSFRYDAVGLVILVVVVLVIGIELISNKVRKELLSDFGSNLTTGSMEIDNNGKIRIRKFTKQKLYLWTIYIVLSVITIYTIFTINTSDISIETAFKDFFTSMKVMFFQATLSNRYTYTDIFQSLTITIAIAVITTLFGSVIALFLSFFAAGNLSSERVSKIIKVCMSFIRAVPTILWVMVFSIVASIGVEAAVLGMVFHSVAYLVKAYSESIEEIDKGVIEALKSTGASWWQIIFQGVLPISMSSILSWTFVRFEINFTNAVVVGAASGAGGIGYEMFMAGTMYFDMREIGFFTYLIFGVTLTLEMISMRLRKKYISGK